MTATPVSRSAWLESPAWDSFWILNGIWLLVGLLLAKSAGLESVVTEAGLWAVMILWGGHIVSPMVSAWTNPGLRNHMLERRQKFVYGPAAVLLVCIAFGSMGNLSRWITHETVNRYVNPHALLFYGFLVWNTWHFSAQHFGILTIYRKLSNQTAPQDRSFDRRFTVFMTCVLIPIVWYGHGKADRLGRLLELRPAGQDLTVLMWTVIAASALVTAVAVAREMGRANKSVPKMLYLVAIGSQPVFLALSYNFFNMLLFSASHWLIAIALSARISSNLAARGDSGLHRFGRSHLAQVGLLMSLSIPFYYLAFNNGWLVKAMGGAGVMLGFYFGISFVHFIYDRFIYSFGNPEVRSNIGVLLFRRAG